MNWADIIPPIIVAIIAATPGIYAIWRGRQKERADAAKVITEAASELVREYKEQLDSLERLVAKQQEEIRCLESQVDKQSQTIAAQSLAIDKQKERIELLESERLEILEGVRTLTAQIRILGQKPKWEPKRNRPLGA